MLRYSHVLWDWNGTLFDDLDWCIDVTGRMLAARGLAPLDVGRYRDVFDFPVKDYYQVLGFDFERESFEVLAAEFMALYHENDTGKSPLRVGAEAALSKIAALGATQSVLSASKADLLLKQMGRFDICSYFDEILGLSDIYAKSKVDIGLDYLSRANAERVLLIGDTTHDYEVARALGADCLLWASGHQSEARLSALGAPLIYTLQDVPKYIEG